MAATPIVWRADLCSAEARKAGEDLRTRSPRARVECARLTVPMDWARPGAGAISVLVTRVPRRVDPDDTAPTRVLVVNPGGPGVPADWMAPGVAFAEPRLHRSSDIIAIDPRGTGGSTPLACLMLDDGVGDYREPTAREIAAQQATARREVELCARQNGAYLRQISTAAMIRDMDHVRSRLGVATVDFYGVSAGTWLGAHYAQTYPRRVGRFVFDANTEFTADWRRSFGGQPQGFERRFRQQFLPWLARNNRTYGLGTTTAATSASYERLRARIAAGELYGVSANDLDLIVVQGLYFDDQFPDLAQVLAALTLALADTTAIPGAAANPGGAVNPGGAANRPAAGSGAANRPAAGGDAAKAAILRFRQRVLGVGAQQTRSAEDTVFMAVQCNDDAWDRDPASYVREGLELGRRYPLLGYTWVTSACAYWPFPFRPLPRATGVGVPPILMVQAELDPATPWEGASRAQRAHASARMLAVDDSGNHGSLMTGNTCVETAVTNWLVRGTLPAPGTVCRGAPLPGDPRAYEYRLRPVTTRPTPQSATPTRTTAPDASAAAGPRATGAGGLRSAARAADRAAAQRAAERAAAERIQRRFQQRLLAGPGTPG